MKTLGDKFGEALKWIVTVVFGVIALALVGWGLWLFIGLMAFLMETVP